MLKNWVLFAYMLVLPAKLWSEGNPVGEYPLSSQKQIIEFVLANVKPFKGKAASIAVISNSKIKAQSVIKALSISSKIKIGNQVLPLKVYFHQADQKLLSSPNAVYLLPDVKAADYIDFLSFVTTEGQVVKGAFLGMIMRNFRPFLLVNKTIMKRYDYRLPKYFKDVVKYRELGK